MDIVDRLGRNEGNNEGINYENDKFQSHKKNNI